MFAEKQPVKINERRCLLDRVLDWKQGKTVTLRVSVSLDVKRESWALLFFVAASNIMML